MNTTRYTLRLSDGRSVKVTAPSAEAARNSGYRLYRDATIVEVTPTP